MRNGKDSCLFGEELVSYMYDELPAAERHSFEGHLLDCSSCTAEFAELSMSRLGVYEWHRDEFMPLETPRFAIPYASTEPAYSWLDAIRGFIFTPARLSFAAGALALLVVALGAFYVSEPGFDGVAGVPEPVRVIREAAPTNVPEITKTENEVADDKVLTGKRLDESLSTSGTKIGRKPVVVQAKSVKKQADRQLNARENRPVKAPRLGTFEEVEDTSLRLADLVADIDKF
jgi:Putative zinc-finger